MTDWEYEEQEAWDSFPVQQTPVMTHAARPVTTEVPPGYDGSTNWLKYADAVEEWRDLTKVEARRRGPAIAARLSGRAEIFKERLDRERLRDPETGVDYFLATLRPFFVKDLHFVFLYRFFQMLRCNRGQTDHQRWMVKYEIARQKAVDAWLDATTPKPAADHADVAAQVQRLREAARECLRAEARRGLGRRIALTALTLHQLRDFFITLFHAPKSSLENPSWAHKSGPRSFRDGGQQDGWPASNTLDPHRPVQGRRQ